MLCCRKVLLLPQALQIDVIFASGRTSFVNLSAPLATRSPLVPAMMHFQLELPVNKCKCAKPGVQGLCMGLVIMKTIQTIQVCTLLQHPMFSYTEQQQEPFSGLPMSMDPNHVYGTQPGPGAKQPAGVQMNVDTERLNTAPLSAKV
eukprot:361056-Pelagomonas_calceolata.AAC.1